jgi:hypothetical protein
VNPHDTEAEITRLKDGRTALAYEAEQAVDMETGAIMAVTTHDGAVAYTESIGETVAEAGVAVAEQAVQRAVNPAGIEEVVADKGYHSNEVMRKLAEWKLRSYVAEPERGARKWKGEAAEQAAVYANRRRISGARGKRLQSGRGERVEFCASVRYRRHGPAVCERPGERSQEASDTGGGLQSGAADAGFVWSGKAASGSGSLGPAHVYDFAALFDVDCDLPSE